MNLLHFSDTHLGYSEYQKIDSGTGINQRELDVYRAWEQVIGDILSSRPDVVLHTGDLFHTPRPSNRAIRVALEGIQKISDAGIPMVIIAGNHETPRIKSTGSIFESIALFPGVYAAYQGRYERFRIDHSDFHCIPHCSLTEELGAAFEAVTVQSDARYNIFLSHGAWSGSSEYSMGEFNEQRIPNVEEALKIPFDYIALGHYHKHLDLTAKASYCGSTERTSLNEAGNTCGYLRVNLSTGKRMYMGIKARPMIKLPDLDCRGLSGSDIYARLDDLASAKLDDAIVSLTLLNIEMHTFIKLEPKEIDRRFANTFHFQKSLQRQVNDKDMTSAESAIGSLTMEFGRYLESVKSTELDKERLLELGNRYLNP